MSEDGTYTLVLAKEDFKFSCAHFTIFGADRAELLHGHNYQMQIELAGRVLDDEGLLANCEGVKTAVRGLCGRMDNRILIPTRSSHLEIVESDGSIELRFGHRSYRLPVGDVLLLPLVNTSIELLARMLWHDLAGELDPRHIATLGVNVSETAGQSCWYRGPLPDGTTRGEKTGATGS